MSTLDEKEQEKLEELLNELEAVRGVADAVIDELHNADCAETVQQFGACLADAADQLIDLERAIAKMRESIRNRK